MNNNALEALIKLLEQLRDEKTGCPWAKAQTFSSLIPLTLQEVYELTDAIKQNKFDDVKDELGDLLYHILYYCQIAKEKKLFDLNSISQNMLDKHRRRQDKTFAENAEQAHTAWQQNKLKEKQNNFDNLLDSISTALPALTRAKRLQECASTVGFDWHVPEPVFAKIEEEIQELKDAMQNKASLQEIQNELGDILFSVVNLARILGIDPDSALYDTNNKFYTRFNYIENNLKNQNLNFSDVTLLEMEKLWSEAKTRE